jgi:hypothetical protein
LYCNVLILRLFRLYPNNAAERSLRGIAVGRNATQGGGPITLSYSLAYIDFGLAGLALSDAQRAQIAQIVSGVNISPSTVDLSILSTLLDRRVAGINAGIACDSNGSRVALRVDFDVSDLSVSITKAFFEAGPDDLLAGKDWAMLMDANVLLRDAESKTKDALNRQGGMQILSDPSASWDPSETTINVGAAIRLLAACPNFVDDTDMDVRINVGAQFSVPSPNNLVQHYQLDKELTDSGQVFACTLTGGLLYPFVGAALFAKGKIELTDYLGTIVYFPFLSFGQILGLINGQQLESDISSSLGKTCHKINDAEYQCTTAVDMGIQLVPNVNSRLDLDGVHGVAAGLVMSGPVANLGELFLGSITGVDLNPFGWRVLGACTGNRTNNFHIGNQAKITVDYIPPAQLLKARILSPANGYTLSVNDNVITITPQDPPVSEDCLVRVITNRGVRTITIPAARPIISAEQQALQVALISAAATCFYWSKVFTPIEKIHWLVDPARIIHEGEQQWLILVKAIDPNSSLKVLTPAGSVVFTGRPTRSGNIYASLMFANQGAPSELNLELHRPGLGAAADGVELSVQQTLYSLQARLPILGKFKRMDFRGGFRQPQLRIITNRQISLWDVKNALAPQLISAVALERTVEDEQELVLSHGPEGQGGILPEISRAVASLFDRFGSPHAIGNPSVPGFDKTLYFRTADRAVVYDISSPDAPEEIHSLAGPAWYEGTASTLNLLARHDQANHVVNLYEVAGRHTV